MTYQSDPTFQDGFRAQRSGQPITANPYTHPRQTWLAEVWANGWNAALIKAIAETV